MPAGRAIHSRSQWRALHAIRRRGGISAAALRDMVMNSPSYASLPERSGSRGAARSRARWKGRRFCVRWGRCKSGRRTRSCCRGFAWHGGRSRAAISRQALRTKRHRYGRSLRSR